MKGLGKLALVIGSIAFVFFMVLFFKDTSDKQQAFLNSITNADQQLKSNIAEGNYEGPVPSIQTNTSPDWSLIFYGLVCLQLGIIGAVSARKEIPSEPKVN